ncbi:helix-loop-helix DNA-binding domain-containing protein [Chaetomidium leptoderma]|uniref:Helix-loop-helix DNA-binding domain-containing protein n=1 Tax=Chaetomidium leptoderma TaxID=669021 RepID=A0AAN6VGA6_9PEZI|nr:helix-loop-helix DNA-binding domain-containing protein [Chaetomidium leptoderma]
MSGTTIDSSMSFDPYAMSFDGPQLQTYPDFLDPEDFGTDFTSESAASPLSPLSPALSASSFGFPTTDVWTSWDAAELSPEPETLFGHPTTFSSCPPSNVSLSPAINPMDLNLPESFFPSPHAMLASIPSPQQLPAAMTTALPTDAAAAKRYPSRALKRKSTSATSDEEPAPKSAAVSPPATTTTTTATTPPARRSSKPTKDATATTTAALGPKKTAHNMIEKRYRTNLNDKITQLRDAVPSLRLAATQRRSSSGVDLLEEDIGGGGGGEDGDGGLATTGGGGSINGAKLNKATILSKATEYILQLERRNLGLEAENGALRGRMEGLEVLMMRGGVWS